VFAVLITGAAGAGKTVCLTALSDALVPDEVAHAAIDADEVAWAYPFPKLDERCALLGAACDAHRRAGHELVLVAEVVESASHLADVLAVLRADDHLLVLLDARPETLRDRIVAREPPGWHSLEYLLAETEGWAVSLKELDGVHLTLDTESLAPEEIAARIRAERADILGG
jgi:broad-specificity NMP kinase